MPLARAVSVVAIVDSSPIQLLPALLALKRDAGDALVDVVVIAPPHYRAAAERLGALLRGRGLGVTVASQRSGVETLEEQLLAVWEPRASDVAEAHRVLDVSAASGGSTARAIACLEGAGCLDFEINWFNEGTGTIRRLSRSVRTSSEVAFDIGSSEAHPGITPSEFLSVWGLCEQPQSPYGNLDADTLLPAASRLLDVYCAEPGWNGAYGVFRKLMRPARESAKFRPAFRDLRADAIPAPMQSVLDELARLTNWVVPGADSIRLEGPDDSAAVFFLSGGWLEVVVAAAIRRALPDRAVQINLGTTWGRKPNPEAETDVTFVHDNFLYLLSCKNDAALERLFAHLDRFRALVAEFGESRTRPVLLSTARLEPRHLARCATFEIGAVHGQVLLECLQQSLGDTPRAARSGATG